MSKSYNPNKAKWFNDLQADEQIRIEKREKEYRDKLLADYKAKVTAQGDEKSDGSTYIEDGKVLSLNEQSIPYLQLKANNCENKEDILEFFFIWMVSQGAFRTVVEKDSEDKFVDSFVEAFCNFFIMNNDKKGKILPPKMALRRFFKGVYYGCFQIYNEIKDEWYI